MTCRATLWEWCHDWYKEDLGAAAAVDPVVLGVSSYRVARSGSVAEFIAGVRSAARFGDTPTSVHSANGFRCVRSLLP